MRFDCGAKGPYGRESECGGGAKVQLGAKQIKIIMHGSR